MTYQQFIQKVVILTIGNLVTIRNGVNGIRIAKIATDSYNSYFRHNDRNKSDLLHFLYSYYFDHEQQRDKNAPYYMDRDKFNELLTN